MNLHTRALLLALLLSACASGPEGKTFRGRAVAPDRFGLVVLRTGEDPPALTAEEQSEAFAGHFGFIEASAERGELLVAGPFGQPKDIDDLRGLFLFDASDEAEIEALGAGDPTTRMGVFQQDAMTLDTLDLLRRLPEMLRDREVERARSRDAGPDMASYTVLFADGPALSALDTLSPTEWCCSGLGALRRRSLRHPRRRRPRGGPREAGCRRARRDRDRGRALVRHPCPPGVRATRRQRCRLLVAAALSRPGSRSGPGRRSRAATSGGRRSNSNPCLRRPRRPVR